MIALNRDASFVCVLCSPGLQDAEPHSELNYCSSSYIHCHVANVCVVFLQGYKTLNRIQSRIFNAAYNSNENLLVCAPTGMRGCGAGGGGG